MSEIIDHFIREFETWLSDHFYPALIAAASGTPDPAELTLLLQPWVNQMADLGHQGILGNIQEIPAGKLADVICVALDGLGQEYQRYGASAAIMMLALEPADHILILLSLKRSRNGGSDRSSEGFLR
jgi:hypothetical protein